MHMPVPAPILYETLLTLLEQETMGRVLREDPKRAPQVQEVIRALRKAMSQQKQLEEEWTNQGFLIDHRWS
ncbi:DUF5340 family protein [Candidatus Cyanaurora vandensis]|uniref:DUF5340 family protein n=1 Tax=Candidatus Cyanaurora vandensis TaxID=2714958 RepID=UPI002579E668|nr:DUF5340 family protein [Candidatus Cyanaurora vandensis]